jgi:dTDP-4-amino-4,6-dideoxygalactose transaminase
MTVPFLDLPAQYADLKEELRPHFEKVLDTSAYILGPYAEQFEQAFAEFLGVRHVIGVANGTDALLLSLKALGVGPGDEVVTAANSFVATAEAIAHTGATPVFVDVEPDSCTIDVEQVEAKISRRTKALIPVHLYGQPADMASLGDLAGRKGIPVIEDAAQAHGAAYRGKSVGGFGEAACFSFYPGKNLGAYGDAGAVATNRDDVALTLRKLRDHGGVKKYEHELIGFNSRLDGLQAAVLLVKLKRLRQWNDRRKAHAALYTKLLSGAPGIQVPTVRNHATHVFHLYVIRVPAQLREGLRMFLQSRGIATGIHYPVPLHLTPAFAALGYCPGDCPVAESYAGSVLSLPMFPELRREQIEYVADHVTSYMKECV